MNLTKRDKQHMAKRLQRAMTVGELMEVLKEHPKDMPLGVIGHFGEIHLIDKGDCFTAKGYLTPDGYWRTDKRKDMEVLTIQSPDIGPDPD